MKKRGNLRFQLVVANSQRWRLVGNSLSKDLGLRLPARLIVATFRTSALQAPLVNLLCDEPTVLKEQKSKIRALIGVILKQVM